MKNTWHRIFLLSLSLMYSTFASAKSEITIGTTAGDFGEMAKQGIKPELEKKGYKVKVIEFTDYVTPNLALASGQIQANIFQHKPYLEEFSKAKGLDLLPLTEVPTAPLGLYAGKLKSLEAVKEGSTIAIPNDPTNLARALIILKDLGWIEVAKDADPLLISTRHISKNPKKLKIVSLEAAQLPRSLADVDFAVINGNYATSSGLSLAAALSQEKSEAYLNWAVIAKKDKDQAFAKDLKDAINSEAFKTYARNRFKGYRFPPQWK